MYVPDLEQTGGLVSVGYLDDGHPFPKGVTSRAVLERLVELAKHPLAQFFGYHASNLGPCGISGAREHPRFRYERLTIDMGSTDIYVPGDGEVYVAPSLILHYIDTHQYLPPECFLQATFKCPDPHSEEYLGALHKAAPNIMLWTAWDSNGSRDFRSAFSRERWRTKDGA